MEVFMIAVGQTLRLFLGYILRALIKSAFFGPIIGIAWNRGVSSVSGLPAIGMWESMWICLMVFTFGQAINQFRRDI